ncbi:hypothetical protein [Clostridium sp.]|uniref:hypothetical protein n=1 Tax=Clostridium sp. TaxID=1506 RepID=UPI002FC8649E
MKKVLLLIFFTLLLSSCSYSNPSSTGEKITPPNYEDSPIYGTWKITKKLENKGHSSADSKLTNNIINQNLGISDDYIIINNFYWENVSYKVKIVSASDYYSSLGYTLSPEVNKITGDIKVFSASYNGVNSICDIAIKDTSHGILNISGSLYEVEKSSSTLDPLKINTSNMEKATPVKNYSSNTKTGLVLGLKTSTAKGDSYRTLWISKTGSNLNKIYEISNIVFPRRNGFWTINEAYISNNNVNENIFFPVDLSNHNSAPSITDSLITEQNQHGYSNGKIEKEINYICNDYMSVSVKGEAHKNGLLEPIDKLHIYPISSLPFEKAISIEDIFKGTSVEFIRNEFFSSISSIKGDVTFLNTDESNQNIGISRRDGHWMFTGRIPYIENSTKQFIPHDYNLSLIPPSNFVYYDNLFEPLTKIKESVPYAIDSYSSPDSSLAVVVSDKHIYLYDIIEGPLGNLRLSDNFLSKVPLNEGESIIMSEWATGDYVDSWNKTLTGLENSKPIKNRAK